MRTSWTSEALEMMISTKDDFQAGRDSDGLSLDSLLMYLTEGMGRLARQIRRGDAEQALPFAAGVGAVALTIQEALFDLVEDEYRRRGGETQWD